jgi:hypothetical protein
MAALVMLPFLFQLADTNSDKIGNCLLVVSFSELKEASCA